MNSMLFAKHTKNAKNVLVNDSVKLASVNSSDTAWTWSMDTQFVPTMVTLVDVPFVNVTRNLLKVSI